MYFLTHSGLLISCAIRFLAVCDSQGNMTTSFKDSVRSSFCSRLDPLHGHAFIHKNL